MNAAVFLTLHGVSVDWLENCCKEILDGDTDDADFVVGLLVDMIRAGVSLPTNAADLAAKIMQGVADGEDVRGLVGTKPGRGAPKNPEVAEKHRQVNACVELLKLAQIPATKAVELVGLAISIDTREIWDFPKEEPIQARQKGVGDWNAIPYFAKIGFGSSGDGVLRKLINNRPYDHTLVSCWDEFIDFCTVHRIT